MNQWVRCKVQWNSFSYQADGQTWKPSFTAITSKSGSAHIWRGSEHALRKISDENWNMTLRHVQTASIEFRSVSIHVTSLTRSEEKSSSLELVLNWMQFLSMPLFLVLLRPLLQIHRNLFLGVLKNVTLNRAQH